MAEYETRLISFYARYDVAQVRGDPLLIENEFGKPVEELCKDGDFTRTKDFVETQKRYIEQRRDNLDTPVAHAQIAECLKLLLSQAMFPDEGHTRFERKMIAQRELLTAMYGKTWSKDQREHFEYMFKSLMAWKSYFLSYTNDSARKINERYKKVIVRSVDKKVRDARNPDNDNLLADAIVASLTVLNLKRCFYDKKDIGVGHDLDLKIKPAVDNIFTFIQLVQTETFTAAADNWSFKEWRLFNEASQQKLAARTYFTDIFKDRFAAILTHDNAILRPEIIPDDYIPWRDLIFTKKHYLELPTDPDAFDKMMKTLTGRIVKLQHEIVATVPP